MRKKLVLGKILISFLLILLSISCENNDELQRDFGSNYVVEVNVAKQIADVVDIDSLTGLNLKNKTDRKIKKIDYVLSDKGIIDFYIINFKEEKGFIIISADNRVMPILAFSNNGNFELDEKESGVQLWIASNKQFVKGIRKGEIIPDENIAELWNIIDARIEPIEPGEPGEHGEHGEPIGGDSNPPTIISTVTKGPLLNTTWGQGGIFNDLCPIVDEVNAVSGCPTIALAQILRYHEYPDTYDWSAMPNTIGSDETARLIRDIGEAIDINWGAESSGLSPNEQKENIPPALENTFGYSTTVSYSAYDGNDYNLVKNEINGSRPVYMRGGKEEYWAGIFPYYGGGHAWVCDGYIRTEYTTFSTLYFHMNWGWSGTSNGYFAYNNFNPLLNGEYQDFNYELGIITGIKPY